CTSTPIRRVCGPCCARTATGHPTSVPPRSVMNSRRLIVAPEAQDQASYQCKPELWKGLANIRFGSLAETFRRAIGMSALPPKADMCGATRDVCFGPIEDIAARLVI